MAVPAVGTRTLLAVIRVALLFRYSESSRCLSNEIIAIDGFRNISCLPCFSCPAGEEPSIPCGSVIVGSNSVECRPCKLGTFSGYRDSRTCQPCTSCGKNHIVLSECNRTANTVCGKCGKGFYRDTSTHSCLPCSQCCLDGTDKILEDCKESGLPPSRQCDFYKANKCRTKCGPGQITIQLSNDTDFSCVHCPVCPAGMGTSVPCGSRLAANVKSNIECSECIPGRTYSESRYNSEVCKPCTNCGMGRETMQNCTAFQDTLCGSCKSGFYFDAIAKECHECSWCCNDSNDIIEAHCISQGMPIAKQCRRNHRSVTECHKIRYHINLKPTSPILKDSSSKESYEVMVSMIMGFNAIVIIGVVLMMACWKKFRRKKSVEHPDEELSSGTPIKEQKCSAIYKAPKQSLQVKTITTGCQSNELEWPQFAGPLVSRNAILFEKSGVEIIFPDRETYRKYHNQIALETCWSSKIHPELSSNNVVLSPVIKLHPQGLQLDKSVTIVLPHSARIDLASNEWLMTVKRAKIVDGKIPKWEDFRKESEIEETIVEQANDLTVENNQVKIVVDQLLSFVVIGRAKIPDKTVYKRMQCAVFITQRIPAGRGFKMSLYLLDDCEAPFEKIMETEKKQGRQIMGSLQSFNLPCSGEDELITSVTDITHGWELSQTRTLTTISHLECLESYQVIPQRYVTVVHRDPTKKNFQCNIVLTESSGNPLVVMPVFVYCTEDPSNLLRPKCAIHSKTANSETRKSTSNDSPGNQTLPERQKLRLLDIPLELQEQIVRSLDIPKKDPPNWKKLASELNMAPDLVSCLEKQYWGTHESPTTQLLYLLDAKNPEMNVHKFLQVLRKIDRQDVCELLHDWLQQPEADDISIA